MNNPICPPISPNNPGTSYAFFCSMVYKLRVDKVNISIMYRVELPALREKYFLRYKQVLEQPVNIVEGFKIHVKLCKVIFHITRCLIIFPRHEINGLF